MTGRVSTKSRFVIPKKNSVILNAAEKREARMLAEKMANEDKELQKIEDFQAREEKAREIAMNLIKDRKRERLQKEKLMKNIGLNDSNNEKENNPVVRPPSPPKAAPIDAKKMIEASRKPMMAVKKPGQAYKPPVIGVKTGKKAIMLTNSPPLKAPLIERGKFSVNAKDRLKIGNKLCETHKKNEIQQYLQNSGVVIAKKMTKEEMCQALKKNIFK